MEHTVAYCRWGQIYTFMDKLPKFSPKLPQWGLSHFLTFRQDPSWHRDTAHISAHQVPPVTHDWWIDRNCTVITISQTCIWHGWSCQNNVVLIYQVRSIDSEVAGMRIWKSFPFFGIFTLHWISEWTVICNVAFMEPISGTLKLEDNICLIDE